MYNSIVTNEKGLKISNNTYIYFCKNCGSITLKINKSEEFFLQTFLPELNSNNNTIEREYSISLKKLDERAWQAEQDYSVGLEKRKSERTQRMIGLELNNLCERYENLINAGIITYIDIIPKKGITDLEKITVIVEYKINLDLDINYTSSNNNNNNCSICMSSKIEPFNLFAVLDNNRKVKDYSVRGYRTKYGFNKLEDYYYVTRISNALQDRNIKEIKSIINNYISKIPIKLPKYQENNEYSMVKKENINIKELLSNLIYVERTINILEKEYETLIKKQLEERFNISKIVRNVVNDNKAYTIKAPKEPELPPKPVLKKVSIFTKKKDKEYNSSLTEKYNSEINDYNIKMENYTKSLEEFEKQIKEKDLYNNELDKKVKELLDFSNKNNELLLTDDINIDSISQDNYNNSRNIYMILSESIEQNAEKLMDLYKTKNELINLNKIYPKYNNLIAWSTINEYFITGRVTELDGPNGAYNLYENETRQNYIITKLDSISDKLDEIKQNQFLLFKVMNDINNNIRSINNKIDISLTLSAINAYNTERIARYSKLSTEIAGINAWLNASK